MEKIISIMFSFFFILLSCKEPENKEKVKLENETNVIKQNHEININDFIGAWEIKNDSNENSDTFSINFLESATGKLIGYYCAVARNGNKIDCTPDKEININEVRKEDDQYLVSFKSFFGATKGEARISLVNGKLHWKVVKKPVGEFYCPIEVYLTKKNTENLLIINSNKSVNLNSGNYKGTDITMSLYKDIIEKYGCGGDNMITGKDLGQFNDNEIFIVENDCGDFPFKDLISVKNGKMIDKLSIESSSFDIEKFETQDIKDETDYTFNIIDLFNIEIKETQSINSKNHGYTINKYFLDKDGRFYKK